MDVLKYLEEDHKKVVELLTQLQKSTAATVREKKFLIVKQELYFHEQVEQKILYPSLQKQGKSDVLEAYQEHHVVNLLLKDIEGISFDDKMWQAKITVLLENVKHHIKEERTKLFPLTRKLFDKATREEMTEKMEMIKKLLKKDIKANKMDASDLRQSLENA